MTRLGRGDAHHGEYQQNSRDGERYDVPAGGHLSSGTRGGILQSVLPAPAHHKGHRAALRVRRVTGTNTFLLPTFAQAAEVGEAQTQGLVTTRRGSSPRGNFSGCGGHGESVSRLDRGQAREGDRPGAPHIDHDEVCGVNNHRRSPVQQPSAVAHESEQGPKVHRAAHVGGVHKSADCGQEQGNHDDRKDSAEGGSKDHSGLLHKISMAHERGGEPNGDRA